MIGFIIFFLGSTAFGNQVKEVPLKPNDIGSINTAVGYSTVIQVSQKPLNVVIGDQGSFRVEYIGNNITIKPLKTHAKTNLFIFTENDRFNLSLKSGGETNVDYVVHLKRVYEDPKQIRIINVSKTLGEITLTLTKLTHTSENTFLDFELLSSSKKRVEFLPDGLRVTQGKGTETIKSLYLERSILNPMGSALGSILFRKLDTSKPFTVLFSIRDRKPKKFQFSLAAKKKDHSHEF